MTGIDWDLVARYLGDGCTPSEREWVEQLIAVDPRMASAVSAARDVSTDGDAALPDEEVAGRLAVVKRAGAALGTSRSVRPIRLGLPVPRRPLMGIAAAVALLAGGALAARLALRRSDPAGTDQSAAFSVITTAPGQRLSLRLADGTLVSLAPVTTLRTPADYGRRDRTVVLEGEAIFTVVHDATRPFAVKTPRAVATDLGTRFAVRAYPDDPATDIVVVDGRVAVRQASVGPAAPPDSVILGRGERVRVTDDGQIDVSRNVSLDDYLGWTDGKLAFRGTALRDVARQLARWYDVDIVLDDDAIGGRRIYASVDNEPVVDVLHTIAASLDLRLSRAGRVFTLAPN